MDALIIFVNGKQKRVKRPPTIDGMDVDEFIRRNADPVWLHKNEMWEYMDEFQDENASAKARVRKEQRMKQLKVDLDDIAFVMERQDDLGSLELLDTETGEVVNIPEEVMNAAEYDDEKRIAGMPGWEQELIETAKSILADEAGRFQEIPRQSSSEGYELMAEFVDTVSDTKLSQKLSSALRGRGVFRRFKDILLNFPEEEKRWYAFHDSSMKQVVREWLASIGIEPIEETKKGPKDI